MADYPLYTYPQGAFLNVGLNVFFGGHRSFRQDGLDCVNLLKPPLRIFGAENIPRTGPCLITFNHYYRPGFNAWWMALAMASVIPVDIHFVMTGELTYPGKWYASLGRTISRLLLWRLSKIYGFTTMPPMPPRPKDVVVRARSVRNTLKFAHYYPEAILGLAPEGGDQPGGVLNFPPSGAGRFVLLLAKAGFRLLPVGLYEMNGEFCIRFGLPYDLLLPSGLLAREKDQTAAEIVMGKIAAQLPESLRGAFQEK